MNPVINIPVILQQLEALLVQGPLSICMQEVSAKIGLLQTFIPHWEQARQSALLRANEASSQLEQRIQRTLRPLISSNPDALADWLQNTSLQESQPPELTLQDLMHQCEYHKQEATQLAGLIARANAILNRYT